MANIRIQPWSKADEAELQSMLKRKATFTEEAERPVRSVIVAVRTSLDNSLGNCSLDWSDLTSNDGVEILVATLINYADSIRDALAPFDSGIRINPQSTSG